MNLFHSQANSIFLRIGYVWGMNFIKLMAFLVLAAIVGGINLLWHYWTDWKIVTLMTAKYEYTSTHDYVTSNSLGFVSLYQLVTKSYMIFGLNIGLYLFSGISTVCLFWQKSKKRKTPAVLIFLIVILWVLKVPTKVENSNLIGIERMLLAW